jgi:hypothetical protein
MIQDTAWSPRFVASTTATAATSADVNAGTDTNKFITPAALAGSTPTLTLTDVILGTSGPSAKSSINARAARQGLVFDGTGGGSGTLASAVGTSDLSLNTFVAVPTASNFTGPGIFGIGTVGTANAFSVYVYGDDLYVTLWGASGSDFRSKLLVNFVPSFAGKNVNLVVVRNSTTPSITIYVNGISQTLSETTGGTAPTWGGSISSTTFYHGKLASAGNYYTGYISAPNLYNRALSAAEVVSLFEAGVPAAADYNSASNTAAYTTTFASDDGWTLAAGSSISGGKLNMGDDAYCIPPSGANITIGKRYRLVFTIDSITAGSIYYFNGSGYVLAGTTATTYTIDFQSLGTGTGPAIKVVGGTAVADNYSVTRIGLLLAPDAGQAGGGLTWYDTSGNAANITLPASGVAWAVPSSQKTASGWTFGGNLTVSSSSAYLKLASTGSSNTWDLFSDSNGSFYLSQSGVVNALRVFPTTGNFSVGAGSTDGGQKLQVNGTAYVSGDATFAGSTVVSGTGTSDTLSYNILLGGTKRLIAGFDTTNDYGLIASIHTGIAWKNLVVNPIGGALLIGMTSGTGEKLQAGGSATFNGYAGIADGMTAPSATAGYAKIYVDSADGDLKVIFGDGTVKTIVTD